MKVKMEEYYVLIGNEKKRVPNHCGWSIPLTAMIITFVLEMLIIFSLI